MANQSKTVLTGELRRLPMMPIRDMVIFPHMMTPFVVGRASSVRALEEALSGNRKIFLATQHDAAVDEPSVDDIYETGTIGNIVQSVRMPDGNIKVLVEGVERARSVEVSDQDGFFVASVRTGKTLLEVTPQVEQLMHRVHTLFEQYVKLQQSLNHETMAAGIRMDEPAKLADTIAANLQLSIDEKQQLLEVFDPETRLARVGDVLDVAIEKLNMDRTIQSRVKRQMEKAQKEYYLNEKIKAIQKELGRGEKSEFDELKKKIETAGMPKDVIEKSLQELRKLEAMPPMSAESTVSRNYLDWLLAVPWKKRSKEIRSIEHAEKILNSDHYGLEKIKERILEFPRGAPACEEPQGFDPLLRGTSRRGQDVAGNVDRQGDGQEVCAPESGWRARRGGDPRSPPDVHRRVAGADYPVDEEGGNQEPGLHAGRDRQDGFGLPGRSGERAAGGFGPGAERLVPGPLSGRGVRPVQRVVRGHGQCAAHDSRGLAGPHGDSAAARLHRAGEDGDRQAVSGAQAARSHRADRGADRLRGRRAADDHPRIYARGRSAQSGA
jgi:Lon protease-like protein